MPSTTRPACGTFAFADQRPWHSLPAVRAFTLSIFWNDFAADEKQSIPEDARRGYVLAYSRPGRMAGGFSYFAAFPKTATDFAELAATQLKIPVLSIGGDKSLGIPLAAQAKLISPDVTVIILKNTGHWIAAQTRSRFATTFAAPASHY